MLNKHLMALIFVALPFIAKAQNTTLSISSSSQNFQTTDLFSQQPIQLTSNYSTAHFNKVLEEAKPKHPLVKTGKILTFIGLPLAILGGIMVSSADQTYYNCTNGDCEGDPQGAFGAVILATGVGMTGTGIVLWTIGANKSK